MDTKTAYLWTVICPKKLTLAHNVFEGPELCRTRADILKPSLDRTLVVRRSLKYKQCRINVEVIALICEQKESQSLSSKIFPKIGFKATIVF